MSVQIAAENINLQQIAHRAFDAALAAVNSARAVEAAVGIDNERLLVVDFEFDLREIVDIYAVALGKAAFGMAKGLSEILGDKLTGGVISAPKFDEQLPQNWQTFAGGHPTPNAESLAAANAAFELLKVADKSQSLVIFLVSGGGSAMMEMPSSEKITLADLQTANKILIGGGATIGEVNALRRRFSSVKGGGLSRRLTAAKSVSLIVSDTNDGEFFNVASGPTIESPDDLSNEQIQKIIERDGLREKLPPKVLEAVQSSKFKVQSLKSEIQNCQVLLSNQTAVEAAANAVREQDFTVEIAADLIETPIEKGCAELVKRLCDLREKVSGEKRVAIVSGGEFVCPVKGNGIGGRNLEAALRTAVLFDELSKKANRETNFAALFGGTDGIDGNSPAAGASVDETTIDEAEKLNLDAKRFLEASDSYNFFARINRQVETGATGTNVRDVRILLAN